MYFSLTYEANHLENRLPKGVQTNDATFHAGIHSTRVFPMHSCSIFSHDNEFISNIRDDGNLCDVYVHTDYCLKVCSTKLFTESKRNQDGKLICIMLFSCIY